MADNSNQNKVDPKANQAGANTTQSGKTDSKPGETSKKDEKKAEKKELPNANNILKTLQSLAGQINNTADAVIKNKLESKIKKLIPATQSMFDYINNSIKNVNTLVISEETQKLLSSALDFTKTMAEFAKIEFKPIDQKVYAAMDLNIAAIQYMIKKIGEIQIDVDIQAILTKYSAIDKFINTANKTAQTVVSNLKWYILAFVSITQLYWFIKRLANLSKKLSTLEIANVNSNLVILQNEMQRVLDIIQTVVKINKLSRHARLSNRTIRIVVGTINKLLKILALFSSKRTLKNVIKSNMTIHQIGVVIGQLSLITITLTLLGIFIAVAIIPLTLVVGFIFLLIKLFKVLGSKIVMLELLQGAKAIAFIGLAVLTLALTFILIAVLGKYIIENWLVLSIVVIALVVIIALFGAIGSKHTQNILLDGAKGLAFIAGSMLILGLTVLVLVAAGNLITAEWPQILKVGLMMVVLVGIMFILSLRKKQIQTGSKELLYIAGSMIILSVAVGVLAFIAGLVTAEWDGILKVGALLGILTLCMIGVAFAGKMIKEGESAMKTLAKSIIIAAAAILVLAIAVQVAGDMVTLLEAAGIMIGIVLLFGIGVVVLSKLKVDDGLKAMQSITLCIIGVAAAMIVLSIAIAICGDVGTLALGAAVICGVMVVFAVACGVLAGIGPVLAIGAAFMIALCTPILMVATSMYIIAIAMEKIMKLNITDEKKMVKKMTQPIKVIGGVLKEVQKLNWWKLVKAAAKMRQIGKVTEVIGEMSDVLQKMSSLRIPEEYDKEGKVIKWRTMNSTDFAMATINIKMILTHIVKTITDPAFIAQLENTSKKALKNLAKVMESTQGVTHIFDVVEKLANGKVATGWKTDKDGNAIATGYVSFTDHLTKNKNLIKKNLTDLINLCVNAMWDVINNETMKDRLDDVQDEMKDLSEVMTGAVGIVDAINNSMNSDKKNIDATKYTENLQIFMDGVAKTLFSIDITQAQNSNQHRIPMFKSIVELFSGMKPVDEKSTKSIKTNIDATEKLLKTINKTDLSKLKYVYSLMWSLTQFSKSINGNFDKLADIINEDLITAIKKLEETLSGFNTSINVNTSSGPAPTIPTSLTKSPQKANDKAKAKLPTSPKIDESTLKRIQDAVTKLANAVQGYGSSAALRVTN